MQVPLLNLKAQYETLGASLEAAVVEVLRSTRYIMGPKIEELEAEIAHYCEVKHALAVSSGTDALLVSLMALGIGPGDIVLTTNYSFFATAGVISRLGARPVFIDVDRRSYNIDPKLLAQWFDEHRADQAKVKAIIAVHLYGQCAEMDVIIGIAKKYGVPVVEDAAQAIGARYQSKEGGKFAGSMGLVGCYSFFPSKNLGGVGDGGMVVTNDSAFAERLRMLREHGAKPKYHHSVIGGNFRLDPIQAAALLVKLPHLNSWHAKRRQNAAYYDERLSRSEIETPAISGRRDDHIYNQYVITVSNRRNELRDFLAKNEIGSEVYYPVPFHRQECFQNLNYPQDDFPISSYAANHTLALPIYPELTTTMQDYVIAKIGEFYD